MQRSIAAVCAALVLVLAVESALAKSRSLGIRLHGITLANAVQIYDPEIVSRFSIWNGPGVAVNGRPVHFDPERQSGMFIDWSRGKADERPAGLARYIVTFYLGPGDDSRSKYFALYEFDPATPGGYIYLFGRSDERGLTNTALIYHGVEGNWFRSSKAWEELVRPRIEKTAM